MQQTMMRIILALAVLTPGVVHAQSTDFPRHDGLVLMGVILQSTPIHPYTRKLDSHHDRYPTADPAAREDIIHNWKILITRYPRTYIRAQILYLEDQGSLTPEMRADFEAALAWDIDFRWSDPVAMGGMIKGEQSPYLQFSMRSLRDQLAQQRTDYEANDALQDNTDNIAEILEYIWSLNSLATEGFLPAMNDMVAIIKEKSCTRRMPNIMSRGIEITIASPHRICSIADPKLRYFWNLHFRWEGLPEPFPGLTLEPVHQEKIYQNFMTGVHPFANRSS